MKTKADLLAHITALTKSGEIEWSEVSGVRMSHLPNGLGCLLFRMELKVSLSDRSLIMSAVELYELVDGMQPLPEWVQEVGASWRSM